MTNACNVTNTTQKRKHSYMLTIICAIVFFVLLLLRDTYAVGINKYLFIGIVCLCAVCMKTDQLIYLFCFLFPLYVGLPGNYLTLVLFARLLFETRRVKSSSFIVTVAVAAFVFLQNIFMGFTGMVPMMFIVGVIVVMLLFTHKQGLKPLPMVLMYSAGVASLGFIMLASTLQVYEMTDLLSTSFRLGSSSVDYVEEGIMNVSMDPNFYGSFAIASISLAFPLIFQAGTRPVAKVCLALFVFTQLAVCLIGLSRAFVVILMVWMLLYLLSRRSIKGTVIAVIAIACIIILFVNFMPDVIETVLARFDDSDMATGNGRLTLIAEFWNEWGSSALTMLFGVGMYNCNVHCMPLQFLFGGGVVLFLLMVALAFSYRAAFKKKHLSEFLPLIVTFAMLCTVPAGVMLNYMFPLVLTGLILHISSGQTETEGR